MSVATPAKIPVIPARHRGLNRAEICDQNFIEFVRDWDGPVRTAPAQDEAVLPGSACTRGGFPRAVRVAADLPPPRPDGARAARAEQGLLHDRFERPRRQRDGRAADPAYRSGLPALPLAARSWPSASASCRAWIRSWIRRCRSRRARTIRPPAAATRSGAASRCGCCRRPRRSPRTCPRRSARRWRSSRRGASATRLPIPDDSIAICSFGDASSQPRDRADRVQRGRLDRLPEAAGAGAVRLRGQRHRHFGEDARRLDRAQFQRAPRPRLFLRRRPRPGRPATPRSQRAVEHCRAHAPADLPASAHDAHHGSRRHRFRDRVAQRRGTGRGRGRRSAAALGRDRARIGPASARTQLLARYEAIRARCFAAADEADRRPKLDRAGRGHRAAGAVHAGQRCRPRPTRADYAETRLDVFGGEDKLPENLPPRHLAIQINQALHDLFCKYPEALLFGEDVAQKGGVYTVTKGLHKAFRNAPRVQHPARRNDDPRPGPGLRQHGHAADPGDPVPGLFPQRLRPDPRRGVLRCSSSPTTSTATRWSCASPGSATRRASAGISTTTTRSPRCATFPGLVVGCPSARRRCGDDAAHAGRAGQGRRPGQRVPRTDRAVHDQGPVRGRRRPVAVRRIRRRTRRWRSARRASTTPEANDLVIFTYGNGVPMSLRAAREIEAEHGWKVRVVDLRWLVPLNEAFIAEQAANAQRILVVDEGRHQRRRRRRRDHRDRRSRTGCQAAAARGRRRYLSRRWPARHWLVLPADADIVAAADEFWSRSR